MSPITHNNLPEAIQLLLDRIDQLERVVLETRQAPVVTIQDSLMNADQAARYLGKAIQTIYGLVSRKAIPHVGKGKHLRFNKTDLNNWLKTA
jgi:excisionase family DNA binding protein